MKIYFLKILFFFLLFNVFAFYRSSAQDEEVDYSLFEKKEYTKGEHTLPYRILWPENMNPNEKYPLVIILHGIGLGGTDNEKQLQRGAYLFLKAENRKKHPCIVVYPQVPLKRAFVSVTKNGKPSFIQATRIMTREESNRNKIEVTLSPYGEMVYDVIEQLIVGNTVDTNRIYIGGVSMGAFSTYGFIAEYPDLFAAAIVMAGSASVRTIPNWAGKVPVWIIHGEKDNMVPVENSRLVVGELKRLGVTNFRYSEYEGVKHHCWDVAFEDPDFLDWFFSKSKAL